jgi:hypothetical protein
VYRGSIPYLYGKYVFADFSMGKIWAVSFDEQNEYNNTMEVLFEVLLNEEGVSDEHH